jgi:hypothetical protein
MYTFTTLNFYSDKNFIGICLEVINYDDEFIYDDVDERMFVYVGPSQPLIEFLKYKVDGSTIKLDGFRNVSNAKGVNVDTDRASHMVLTWENGHVFALYNNGTDIIKDELVNIDNEMDYADNIVKQLEIKMKINL